MVAYQDALLVAADLIEEIGTNPEYERGQIELLADMFSIRQMPIDVRKDMVERDLRTVLGA